MRGPPADKNVLDKEQHISVEQDMTEGASDKKRKMTGGTKVSKGLNFS